MEQLEQRLFSEAMMDGLVRFEQLRDHIIATNPISPARRHDLEVNSIPLEVEDGAGLAVSAEEPRGNMYAECLTDLGANSLPPFWQFTLSGSDRYSRHLDGEGIVPVFIGKYIEYSAKTNRIWIYNQDRNFRILYQAGVVISPFFEH